MTLIACTDLARRNDRVELGQLLSILRKWLWLILACAFVFAAAAYLISESIDPVYEAKVTMMIDQPGSALFANLGSLSTGEDLALTYSKLLTTRPLLELVICRLHRMTLWRI
jgi:uncharacterized protein involved in exopolysaccharide biosynthesis